MLRLLRTDQAFSEHFMTFLLARNIRTEQQVVVSSSLAPSGNSDTVG
jgi:hypothetical protein